MGQQALSGLKAVEWGNFIAAPFCTELLAQLGAEVLKIEPPGAGDEARRYGPFPSDIPHPEKSGLFLCLNANKFGITLDPTKLTGREILLRLLQNADIFVVNQPQLDFEQLKLDFDSLKKANQKLIMVSITPFGETGPYKDWKGYDLNCCALSGITNTIGYPNREPLTPPLHQGHHQAGLMAATAIMLAVMQRDKTGEGRYIDLAEADAWATVHIGIGIQSYIEEGRVRRRSGHISPHRPYPDEVLPCKDGFVCIDTPQNRQWRRFLELMGNPEWANDPIFADRIQTSDEYYQQADAYLSEWLMQHTKPEIFNLCQDARVPAAPVRTVDEVVNDEHMKQRGFFVQIDHPDAGKLTYPGVCYKFSKTPYTVQQPAPRLGEHNKEIYFQQLGYSKEDLVALQQEEII
jgi:crotonobetainyl-CoA:carnitine CoA-transferase CaiB-like acyl-CoA transferase